MRALFIFIFLWNVTSAQVDTNPKDNTLNKNNIHFHGDWSIIAYGIGLDYERVIPSKKYNMYNAFSIGTNLYEVNFFSIDQYIVPTAHYGIILGLECEHHFEAKAGIALGFNRNPLRIDDFGLLPSIKAGYRYQAPKKNVLFRTGVGFPEIIYLGLGFSL